jgi:prepilin-type N-terminal cleavage/methylation domain-containing protein
VARRFLTGIDSDMTISVKRKTPCADAAGFTLMELILATAISAIVIGILTACLSFAMRAWESVQNRAPDQTAMVIDLFKRQLAEIDMTPIKFQDGVRPLFNGQHNSITFATAHSVKALSQGVPVAVRYSYDPRARVLVYSEVPFDPYHPQRMLDFMSANQSGNAPGKTLFYQIDLPGFDLSYAGKDDTRFREGWDKPREIPMEVLLAWNTRDYGAYSQLCLVNCPFPISLQRLLQQQPITPQASSPGGILQND